MPHFNYAGFRYAELTGEADETLTLTAGSGDYTFTVAPPRTPFTRLALTTGTPAAITAGGSGDIPMVGEGRSTVDVQAILGAQVPAGWTVTATRPGSR